MKPDIIPLIAGAIVLAASLISLRTGLSVAIIEIVLGAIAGNLGFKPEEWMTYLAGFGGIILTYLAGAEVDTRILKQKFKISMLIGGFSFLMPFIMVFVISYFLIGWEFNASLIAGIALSTTSLAVVYSVLVETGLTNTKLGKIIMASTFITDMGTALALSVIFIKPTLYTLLFFGISILVIFVIDRFSLLLLRSPKISNKVIEPEIKIIFLVLLLFIYFAHLGESHAVLPAFILGLIMSKHFKEHRKTKLLRNKLRTVSYSLITPFFFIVGGLKVSAPLIWSAIGLFVLLFFLKMVAKFVGVFFLAQKYIPQGKMYTTLLMSTGLTFGTISALFGLNAGYISEVQYSVLVGVIVASAIVPTFVAQKWYKPKHNEDIF
ncbi:MAG: cation:proton antiporter [Ignavibacteria bacterium]|nr:cation:proton antiporter [Ignavibacteria bacterium]